MSTKKWYISYDGQKEPDYKTTYFYEVVDKSFERISFRELKKKNWRLLY